MPRQYFTYSHAYYQKRFKTYDSDTLRLWLVNVFYELKSNNLQSSDHSIRKAVPFFFNGAVVVLRRFCFNESVDPHGGEGDAVSSSDSIGA